MSSDTTIRVEGLGKRYPLCRRPQDRLRHALPGPRAHAQVVARYADIVGFADIGEFIDRPVKTYSTGMYLRLAFAVAVCADPDVLLVDEVLSVGDVRFQAKCIERMRALQRRGTTILFVSHAPE